MFCPLVPRLSPFAHITYIQTVEQCVCTFVHAGTQARDRLWRWMSTSKKRTTSPDESLQPVSELCYDLYYTSFPLHLWVHVNRLAGFYWISVCSSCVHVVNCSLGSRVSFTRNIYYLYTCIQMYIHSRCIVSVHIFIQALDRELETHLGGGDPPVPSPKESLQPVSELCNRIMCYKLVQCSWCTTRLSRCICGCM